jgi:hypothetical protein
LDVKSSHQIFGKMIEGPLAMWLRDGVLDHEIGYRQSVADRWCLWKVEAQASLSGDTGLRNPDPEEMAS